MIIKNVRIIDPISNTDKTGDIAVENGKIFAVHDIPPDFNGDADIDATGMVAVPGLVDMHVHMRDPGFTYKEDIITAAAAAAAGGFTAVACMPNTNPVIDSPEGIRYVLEKGRGTGVHVLPIAAVTMGQQGKALTDMAALKAAGAVCFSDDGVPIDSAVILRAAMQNAVKEDTLIISHCEDREMVQSYGVNEGAVSRALGMPGRPAIAEELMVARDLLLAENTGARLHIAHVSTKGSAQLIRQGKRAGIKVTAETCPQYFTLTENAVLEKGSLARVNPPLRTDSDVEAIVEGLFDGTIDAIVTDHAPHSAAEKSLPIAEAPSGMLGLETSLALSLTALYHRGKFSLMDIIRLMSANPAEILGIGGGGITKGVPADITIFDPDEPWIVDPEKFRSKARNTPFGGMELFGKVKYTIINGEIVFGGAENVN